MIRKSDCVTCHKFSERLVGPSFSAIADKYFADSSAAVTKLTGKILNGGSGSWGALPMTPHPSMSRDEALLIVKYILSLKK